MISSQQFQQVRPCSSAVDPPAFVALSSLYGASGQVFVVFVMTVAAAEAAVGLAIIIAIFRHRQSVNLDDINLLKG